MRKWHYVTLGIIGWYLLMITVHYFNQQLLWHDEQLIFANISKVPLERMFHERLLYDQEFPRLYLLGLGFLSQQFSYHLLALHFLPFVCMFLAFLVWIYLASKQIQSKVALLTFFLCWIASSQLIYYAAELKQYSMDVLVCALFLFFLYHQKEMQKTWSPLLYSLILIGLAVLGFVSYAAFFFIPLSFYNICMDTRENGRGWLFVGVYLVASLGCLIAVYSFDFRHTPGNLMTLYWKDYMISFDSPAHFFQSVQEGFNGLISRWFALKPKWIRMGARFFIGLGLIGLFARTWPLFKMQGFRFKGIGAIGGFVLLECFILSAFKKIPFGVPRFYLFFAPILLFFTVETIEWIKGRNQIVYRVIQGFFMAYLIYVAVGLTALVFGGHMGAEPNLWE